MSSCNEIASSSSRYSATSNKVSYRKQIARQYSWSTVYTFASLLIDHHAKCGCCFSYCMRTFRKSQKFGGRWGPALWDVGVADPLEISFSPPVLPDRIRSF